MDQCIFCQIVAGKADAAKIYEDDQILAFLDIRPLNPGCTVVIPKQHFENFIDITDELVSHLVVKSQAIGRKINEIYKPEKIGYVVHGYGLDHAHYKITPLNDSLDIASAKYARVEDGKVVFDEYGMLKTLSLEELKSQADKIKLN